MALGAIKKHIKTPNVGSFLVSCRDVSQDYDTGVIINSKTPGLLLHFLAGQPPLYVTQSDAECRGLLAGWLLAQPSPGCSTWSGGGRAGPGPWSSQQSGPGDINVNTTPTSLPPSHTTTIRAPPPLVSEITSHHERSGHTTVRYI